MTARNVSTARELHHPHEARAPVVVVTDQQAPECWRRRVDHDVGKRKPALRSDVGINLALQNIAKLLLHMLGWFYRLDEHNRYHLIHTKYTQTITYKYMSET